MVVKVSREIAEMNRNFLGSVADQSGFESDDSGSDSGDQPSRSEQAINYVIRGLNKMKEVKKDVDEEQDEAEEGQVGPVCDVSLVAVVVITVAHGCDAGIFDIKDCLNVQTGVVFAIGQRSLKQKSD